MAVLWIIGIYVIILILVSIAIKAEYAVTKIIALVLWVAVILWLIIGKPAFWEGHKTLTIICDILCTLVIIGMVKEDDEKKGKK